MVPVGVPELEGRPGDGTPDRRGRHPPCGGADVVRREDGLSQAQARLPGHNALSEVHDPGSPTCPVCLCQPAFMLGGELDSLCPRCYHRSGRDIPLKPDYATALRSYVAAEEIYARLRKEFMEGALRPRPPPPDAVKKRKRKPSASSGSASTEEIESESAAEEQDLGPLFQSPPRGDEQDGDAGN